MKSRQMSFASSVGTVQVEWLCWPHPDDGTYFLRDCFGAWAGDGHFVTDHSTRVAVTVVGSFRCTSYLVGVISFESLLISKYDEPIPDMYHAAICIT
ncbi:hypothetical protein AVEN_210871-1 [Araneus ventricosus]|uniref:Uncharacterized protein n=1 Tax=Araneus ventricosus TaxID=182803 RepID=A0A4Y2MKW1_ARAVE|nr:hypothetical protein AVEN_231172-1 [Araneus ventricosus]GBN27232.1 hypothetical protein AVEN_37472-1 [Araneus ventricosus]GBN27255.1 hypothetical protein AVEN_122029-1 [Araneus ventricosus]GBN27277.1 hypothetical protein AVEN_210871-1 [Araneus ventricosus]